MQPHRMTAHDWLLLGALSVLWGGSFLFYKVLATALPPLTTVLGRLSLAWLALWLGLRAAGAPVRIPRAEWHRFLLLAALNNVVPFSLYAWGETRVSSGTAAILNAMTPVFTLLVSALVLRTERLGGRALAAVACGFAGVAVLVGPSALLGDSLAGQAACLGAALSYGFGIPYGRRFAGLEPARMALGQLAAGTLLLLPLELAIDRPWTLASPGAAGWASLLGLALASTALAYLIFFRILARAGATNIALVTFLVPVSALLLGGLLLGERVTPQALAGMALIALALAAIDGRPLRGLTVLAGGRRTGRQGDEPAR